MTSLAIFLALSCGCMHEGSAQIIGIGTMPCAQLSKQAQEAAPATSLALLSWLQGFESSLNVFRQRAGKPVKILDDKTYSPAMQVAYVMSYCRKRPGDPAFKGIMQAYLGLPSAPPRKSIGP
jgi:hypothetical protein